MPLVVRPTLSCENDLYITDVPNHYQKQMLIAESYYIFFLDPELKHFLLFWSLTELGFLHGGLNVTADPGRSYDGQNDIARVGERDAAGRERADLQLFMYLLCQLTERSAQSVIIVDNLRHNPNQTCTEIA